MRKHEWIALAILGAQFATLRVSADDATDAIEALKKQIANLSAKVQDLEDKQRNGPTNTTTATNGAPFITVGIDGFSLRSSDTNFVLGVRAYGQFDSHYYASRVPGHDTFTIRRLRVVAEGIVYKYFDYKINTDFGQGNSVNATNNSMLQDAWVNFHFWPQLQIQAGKFRQDLSLEVMQSDANLEFLERGLPTELAPNRDVGIEVHGQLFNNTLYYSAGAFNGIYDGGSDDIEAADNSKDVVWRLFAIPFTNATQISLQRLGIGVGGSYGTDSSVTPAFATLGRETFFNYANGVTANGPHVRVDPQFYYYWGPFGAYGEYIVSSEKFQAVGAHSTSRAYLENKAWNIGISYYLTGETNYYNTSYNPVDIKHPFKPNGSDWGAWELVARIGALDLDKEAFPTYAAVSNPYSIESWGVGLNWILNRKVKLNIDYEQASFRGGSRTPGTLSTDGEKAFLTRLQFGF